MKRKTALILSAFVVAVAAYASTIVYSGYLVDETALSVDTNFVLDLKTAGKNRRSIDTVAASAIYAASSSTSAVTFTDGGLSTGSFTVSSLTNIAGAKAHATVTVTSTSTLKNAAVTINGKKFRNGYEWTTKASPTLTATAIAAKVNYLADIDASASGAVVYATAAAVGTAGNSYTVVVSTFAGLSRSGALFTGGLNAAALTIGETVLTEGVDWTAVDTATGTAAAIVTAINANSTLSAILTATRSTADVVLTAKAVGDNDLVLSSNFAGITASGAAMTGGSASDYTINTSSIYSLAHGYDTGLGVVYSTGSDVAIDGLTDGTTYYVGYIDANHFALATSTTNAVAGTYIVLASSSTAGPHDFTLTPESPSGSFGLVWQTSDDNTNWTDLPDVSSVTFATPFTAGVTSWDFGALNHRYLRAKTTAGDSGAWKLQIPVTGRNSN